MIVYLHGFGSTGNSAKVKKLRKVFGDENVLSPDLPMDPKQVSELISNFVGDYFSKYWEANQPGFDVIEYYYKRIVFVGTSLGAFYARYFSHLYDCPAVLVNPSVYPNETLRAKLGVNQNYVSGEEFLVTIAHLEEFSRIRNETEKLSLYETDRAISLFLAKDDEVIPYEISLQTYNNVGYVKTMDDGGHRFDKHWDLVVDRIKEIQNM